MVAVVALFALARPGLVLVAVMLPALALHGAPLRPDDPSVATFAGTHRARHRAGALAAGMGFAIATIGRNTAAALGAGFAYIIVLENILGHSLARLAAMAAAGQRDRVRLRHSNAGDVPGRSVIGAGVFLAVVAVTLLVAAAGAFQGRDVG